MSRQKIIGYRVMESRGDYEQALRLRYGPDLPVLGVLGVLDWGPEGAALFATRAEARAAINRSYHYAKAFGEDGIPERRLCSIKPLREPRR